MADLQTELAGVTFKNPVVITSSSLTNCFDKMKRLEEVGAGGLITKAISPFSSPNYHEALRAAFHGSSWAVAGDARITLVDGVELIRRAKKELSVPIIANVIGLSDDEEVWGQTCLDLQRAGADMIELDLNCHPEGELVVDVPPNLALFDRLSIGQDPVITGRVVKAVKQAVDIPVIGKLSPRAPDVIGVAQACEANGADGISAINAVRGLLGVDITRGGRPLFRGVEVQGLCAIVGPELNPIGLTYTAMLSKTVDLPLISGGGVMTWEHVVERLMLGAQLVGICSTVYMNSLQAVSDCVAGLESFLNEYGYADCEAIRGCGLEFFGRNDQAVVQPSQPDDETRGEERVGW